MIGHRSKVKITRSKNILLVGNITNSEEAEIDDEG